MSIFSVVRLLRALRLIRVLRVLQHASNLKLLVCCIVGSLKPLFWSFVLIAAMTYINGVYITQLITVSRRELQQAGSGDSADAENLEQLFGNLGRTLLSLFQAISGGLDWDAVVQPVLKHVSAWTALLLVLYITFAILAVMNVVTGLFVQNAMDKASEVRQMSVIAHARKLFEDVDVDTSGTIEFEELQSRMHLQSVQDCFNAIDIQITEARCLFEILDEDGSGKIDFQEFIQACLRLQGPARSGDLLLSLRESRRAFDRQQCMHEEMQAELRRVTISEGRDF
eukprot:TRINITY_DN79724_c0_g1_i1.p1 TRINITY_DN79724_c0_g1~~TRINITY_DN79724_c0_g1_i1.p1  ORF type:complete len:291 (+),score=45.80 TRINITY_DN79724_c0_g1_i1:26-874(+)